MQGGTFLQVLPVCSGGGVGVQTQFGPVHRDAVFLLET